MMDSWIVSFSLLVTFVTTLLFVAARKLRETKKRYEHNGVPFLGLRLEEFVKFLLGETTFVDLDQKAYAEATARNVSAVACADLFGTTAVHIRDVNILKNIFVKDFEHFVNHKLITRTKVANKHFRKMLFSMENDQWKGLRAKISPAFTTGRIKRMSEILRTSGEDMVQYLKQEIGYPNMTSGDIEFSKITIKFGVDVIASCAFGIDSHAWNFRGNDLSTFEKMGNRLGFRLSGLSLVKFITTTFAPRIMDFLNIDAMDYTAKNYFETVIKTVAKKRRETGQRRDDFLQLMLDIQQGLIKADDESALVMNGTLDETVQEKPASLTSPNVSFDDDDLVANGLTFFLGGLEAVSGAALFVLYALTMNPSVQEKLYNEIASVNKNHEGKLTYEAIQDMPYLDMVINESLRFYPASPRTERTCSKDYQVPGTKIVIEKGDSVIIPIYGIHHDPKYYPNPEQFIPERFSTAGKENRSPYAFLPFGHGPRNCIAMRFALIELKMITSHLVRAFEFTSCSKTLNPMKFHKSLNLRPKNGLWLNIKVRDSA